MHGLIFLTVTALTVSVDSFLCGFALMTKRRDLNGRARITVCLVASFTVGALCVVGAFLGARLGKLLAERAQTVGGCVLIAMGAAQLLKGEKEAYFSVNTAPYSSFFKLVWEAIFIGVGIGSDGAMASVLLAASGYPPLLPALAITLCHVALIALGLNLAAWEKIKNLRVIAVLSPLLLLALGVWKVAG